MEQSEQENKIRVLNEYIKQLECKMNDLKEAIEQNDKDTEEFNEERRLFEIWISSRIHENKK